MSPTTATPPANFFHEHCAALQLDPAKTTLLGLACFRRGLQAADPWALALSMMDMHPSGGDVPLIIAGKLLGLEGAATEEAARRRFGLNWLGVVLDTATRRAYEFVSTPPKAMTTPHVG